MIFAAGLSPAWQQILQFDELQIGEVNRARDTTWCASGKVINVAIAAKSLGEQTSLLSVIGGLTGDAIAAEIESYGILTDWIYTDQPTRVCTTILEQNGVTTELVENTALVPESVLDEFIEKFRIHSQVAEVTVLTGSIPANAPSDYYARLIRNLPGRFLLDIRGEGLLQCLPLSPFMVKPNLVELQQTVGAPLYDEAALLDAMRSLNRMGAQWVIVSHGAESLFATSLEAAWRFRPPQIEVVNPIGCGDCLAAGIAYGIAQSQSVKGSIITGITAATLNAGQLLPAKLDWEHAKEISVEVEELIF